MSKENLNTEKKITDEKIKQVEETKKGKTRNQRCKRRTL